MLVNILQTFDFAGRRYLVGDNPDVDPVIARRWIADGMASSDVDGRQDNAVDTAALAAIGLGIRPSNWFATQEFTNPAAYTGDGATFAMRRDVPFPFTGGRVVAYSAGNAPVADCKYAVGVATSAAVTTQATNFVTPTWGGGKTGPVAAGLFKGTRSSNIVEFAVSDAFDLPSVARADGGAGYIVEGRQLVPNTVAMTLCVAPQPDSGSVVQLLTAGGKAYSGAAMGGDFVTTNQAGFTAPGTSFHFILHDLVLFTPSDVFTVASAGDSIARGQYGNESRMSDVRIACDTLTAQGVANIYHMQHTRPGAGVAVYCESTINYVRTMRPSILFYTAPSPNDGGLDVAATLNRTKNWLFALKQACDDYGTKLVLCTSTPWIGTVGQDTATNAFNVFLQDLSNRMRVPFLDRYTSTTNGAVPAGLKAGYNYPTGSAAEQAHPNATCYNALAPLSAAIIRKIIGR